MSVKPNASRQLLWYVPEVLSDLVTERGDALETMTPADEPVDAIHAALDRLEKTRPE